MPTLLERAAAMLARGMKAANSVAGVVVTVTYTRRPNSYTLEEWHGRGMEVNDLQTGARFRISEREFFLTVADMVAAGLDEPRYGDRIQRAGETDVYEVLDPQTIGEPAWRFSDNERTIYRIHTKLVKVT